MPLRPLLSPHGQLATRMDDQTSRCKLWLQPCLFSGHSRTERHGQWDANRVQHEAPTTALGHLSWRAVEVLRRPTSRLPLMNNLLPLRSGSSPFPFCVHCCHMPVALVLFLALSGLQRESCFKGKANELGTPQGHQKNAGCRSMARPHAAFYPNQTCCKPLISNYAWLGRGTHAP